MENKNIILLKRHFVNYSDPKTTTYYLNQCPELSDFEVIDATSHNKDPKFKSEISPMYVGPYTTAEGVVCNVFETLWQCSKVYPCHVDEKGEPTTEYFEWRNNNFSNLTPALGDKKAVKALRHINEQLGCAHSNALYSLWFNKETGKYEHFSYVEARKKIYIPVYAQLITGSDTFRLLKKKVDAGEKIAILDYDAFNYYNPSVKEKMYSKYIEKCKKEKIEPSRSLEDYLNFNTMKDLIDCPFLSCGHGVILKALLQGDIEVVDGKVIDYAELLD